MGAIYALEQIAKDSPADQWTITETLAAFIRTSKTTAERRPMKQAALTVLARRDLRWDRSGGAVDLRGANLAFLNFDGLNLQGFDLTDAAVDGSTFRRGADVTGSVFWPARLYHPEQDYDEPNIWNGPDHPLIDDSLKATEAQMGVFLALKAANEDEMRRAEQKAAEPSPAHDPSG